MEKASPTYADEKLSPTRYRDNPPSYIFPKEPSSDFKGMQKYSDKHEQPSYRKQMSNEDDQPIKKQIKDDKKKHFIEPIKTKGQAEDERKLSGGLMRQQSERYRHAPERVDYGKYGLSQSYDHYDHNYDKYERENLTDRQKHREILESKKYQKYAEPQVKHDSHRSNDYRQEKDYSPEHLRTMQRKSKDRFESREPKIHKHNVAEDFTERNPYREPESLPYLESMMKSPVMKYKSRSSYERKPSPSQDMYQSESHALRQQSNKSSYNSSLSQDRDHFIKDSSPMSTMRKTSPKDRFANAKEKFQAMEKVRVQQESKQTHGVRRSEQTRYEKDYRQSYSPESRYHVQTEWSSEEEYPPNVRDYREAQDHQRRQQQQEQKRIMAPAKSLGNLTKGYRHSYAEPMKYCNRVGLAAIEPYWTISSFFVDSKNIINYHLSPFNKDMF